MSNLILNFPLRAYKFIARIGVEPGDSSDTRLRKMSLSVCLAGFFPVFIGFIGPLYFHYHEWGGAWVYTSFGAGCLIGLVAVGLQPKIFSPVLFLVMAASLPAEFLGTVLLGGFMNSSGAAIWGLLTVMGALVQYGPKKARYWFAACIANTCFALIAHRWIGASNHLPPGVIRLLFAVNLTMIWGFSFFLLYQFLSQSEKAMTLFRAEKQKPEDLLNLFPAKISALLKSDSDTIADHHEEASILFADVVNFTAISERMTPVQLVDMLNNVFSDFDAMAERHGLEKIKTIGDCYMVAAGIPRSRPDHAQALTLLALEIREYARNTRLIDGSCLSFRIGINSGPVVAGLIGRRKFIYDLWGDTVNTASRMESHGIGGGIQITGSTHELIKDEFICEARGLISVKGKGEMKVWHVLGVRQASTRRVSIK